MQLLESQMDVCRTSSAARVLNRHRTLTMCIAVVSLTGTRAMCSIAIPSGCHRHQSI